MIVLNKQLREKVLEENYIIFKHFIRQFNLHERLKRADIPAKIAILDLIKDNMTLPLTSKQYNLQPFCYFTDGGTYNDDHYYFIHNIFQKTTICYSTKLPTNTHVQAYLGKKIFVDPKTVMPATFKVKGEQNQILLPYENYVEDETEDESFKLLGELVLHNKGSGYTCFVSAFAIFISEKEIKLSKSQVVAFFDKTNTVEQFKALGLPIKNETQCADGTQNFAFEIDLSQ